MISSTCYEQAEAHVSQGGTEDIKTFVFSVEGSDSEFIALASDRYLIQKYTDKLAFTVYSNPDGDIWAVTTLDDVSFTVFKKADVGRYFSYIKTHAGQQEAQNYMSAKQNEKLSKGYSFDASLQQFNVDTSAFALHSKF